MADEVYKVGALKLSAEATAGFLFKQTSAKITSKKDEALDHRGNLITRQSFDHRLMVDIEAVLPRAVGVPVPGQSVSLTGLEVPAFSADGGVSSGSFLIADEDESGSGGAAAIDMLVDTEAEIIAQDEKLTRCRFTCERGLQNGIPLAASSSAP